MAMNVDEHEGYEVICNGIAVSVRESPVVISTRDIVRLAEQQAGIHLFETQRNVDTSTAGPNSEHILEESWKILERVQRPLWSAA